MPRDVIRKENVKRYIHVPLPPKNSASGFLTQNLPMAAMFLKNKSIAWACLFIAVQNFLNEPLIKSPGDESTSGWFKILFAGIALLTTYMDLIFPNISGPITSKIVEEAVDATTTAIVDSATGN